MLQSRAPGWHGNGEHSRTPFPWHRRTEWDEPTLLAYRTWLRLRHDHVALRRGGLRWVHVGADSMTFLREHADGSVLVHAARAQHDPVRVPLRVLGVTDIGDVRTLAGADVVGEDASTLALPDDGPAAHAYLLPPAGGG